MILYTYRLSTVLCALVLVVTMAGTCVATPQAYHPDMATLNLSRVESLVKDMQIVVRHRDEGAPPRTYHHFAPTQIRLYENTLIIDGSANAAPADKPADVTITLQISKLQPIPQQSDFATTWHKEQTEGYDRH